VLGLLSAQAKVLQPLYLDVTDAQWPIANAQAIVCLNMIHIAMVDSAGVVARRQPYSAAWRSALSVWATPCGW
jgi:hypothetical protein